jgi:hypothetical protein
MEMQLFLWALAGGILVCLMSAIAVVVQKETPTVKHLARDFLLGTAFTGFVYPLIPETFDEVKDALGAKAGDLVSSVATTTQSLSVGDPGVQIGPPNF